MTRKRIIFWVWIALMVLWLILTFPISLWLWRDMMILAGGPPEGIPFDASPQEIPVWVPFAIIVVPPGLVALGFAVYRRITVK